MRLITHHEIPPALRRPQLLLNILVTRELVQPGDDQVRLQEPVARSGRLQLVVRQDLERQLKPTVQLVLPLLGQATGADDQASLQIASSPA